MQAGWKTSTGKIRHINQDSCYISEKGAGALPNVFIVADGMGGHNGGEIASRFSMAFFLEYVSANASADNGILDYMLKAMSYSNLKVYEKSFDSSDLAGMGTTFTSCALNEGKLYAAHIGDSRIYLISGKSIKQITNDHSYVGLLVKAGQITEEEAITHPKKNILTKVLGTDKEIDADGSEHDIGGARYVLLCSDGLTNMVSDKELHKIVNSKASLNEKLETLIERANENGGYDNITAVLIDTEAMAPEVSE